jgi:glycerophosphoryl diester phosphodiesterase
MRSLIQIGVDGIMTDRPDRLRAVIEDLASGAPPY